MRIDGEVLDITILDEGFNLPTLIEFYHKMVNIKDEVKEELFLTHDDIKVKKITKRLEYINTNIEIVECVIVNKESNLFYFTEYGPAGLN